MSEDEEEEDEQVPDEIPRLQGHLSRRSQKQKYQEEYPKKGIHLQRLTQDAAIKCTLQPGPPPSFPQYTTWRVMLPVGVKVPSIGVLLKSKLD